MSRSLPPGPDGLPLLGSTIDFVRQPLEFQQRCADRYGDVVKISVARKPMYLITDPALINDVLIGSNDRFVKPQFTRSRLEAVFGDGLLVSEGEIWEEQRPRIQPAFYPDRLRTYADRMAEIAREQTSDWEDGRTYDVHEKMGSITLRILVDALFSMEMDYEDRRIGELLEHLYEKFTPSKLVFYAPEWVPTPTNRRYRRAIDQLDELVYEMIEYHRERDGADNLLSALLEAEAGGEISDTLLRDELVNLLLAGHETSALSLTYAWHLLAENPDARARMQAELDDVLGGRPPTFSDLPSLSYTENVFKEAIRLYPPVTAITREPVEDVELGGYVIPEGSFVRLPQWVVHRDERFFDEPMEFRPERWTDEFEDELPEFAYFPFGGGPRQCIGRRFAFIETQLVLAEIGQRFTLEYESSSSLDLQSAGFTVHPKGSVDMTVAVRE